jgi:hypothetical protein
MGAAIPDARVIVHWDSVGLNDVTENVGMKDDKIATSNATGHFSLELPPSVYDVFRGGIRLFTPLRENLDEREGSATVQSPLESQRSAENKAGLGGDNKNRY